MVQLLGCAPRLNQAFQLVEDLCNQNGFRPNVQVYTSLTQACVMRRFDCALQLHDRMVADTRCAIVEKFYSLLVRGCIRLRQLLTAVDVVRATYHLPGGAFSSRPRPVGTEPRTLEELARKLNTSGQEEQNALSRLAADLDQHRGVDLYNLIGHARQTHHCDIKRVFDLVLEIGTGGDPADHDLPEEGTKIEHPPPSGGRRK